MFFFFHSLHVALCSFSITGNKTLPGAICSTPASWPVSSGAFITQHVFLHLRSGGVPQNLASPPGATACCDPWWIGALRVFWDLRAGSVPWAALLWLPEQGDLALGDVSTAFGTLSRCVVHSSLPGTDTAWGHLYVPWTHRAFFLQSFTHCLHLLPGLARAVLEAFCFLQGKSDLGE